MIKKQIVDKDKLILVCYINIYRMTELNSKEFCATITNHLEKCFDDSIKVISLPINDITKPRYSFDVINPACISKEDCENTITLLQELKNILK